MRLDKIRTEKNIGVIIQLLELKDFTKDYQALVVKDGMKGNDGQIMQMFNEHFPYAVKFFHKGLTEHYVSFIKALQKHRGKSDAEAQPGYGAVYHVALPLGYLRYKEQSGLVFNWVIDRPENGAPTAADQLQVEQQMQFLHWLNFCHLDIVPRNIRQSVNDKCYLLDFDLVCPFGKPQLAPRPPESSAAVLRCDPVSHQDDLHLWNQVKKGYFGHVQETAAADAELALRQELEKFKSDSEGKKQRLHQLKMLRATSLLAPAPASATGTAAAAAIGPTTPVSASDDRLSNRGRAHSHETGHHTEVPAGACMHGAPVMVLLL